MNDDVKAMLNQNASKHAKSEKPRPIQGKIWRHSMKTLYGKQEPEFIEPGNLLLKISHPVQPRVNQYPNPSNEQMRNYIAITEKLKKDKLFIESSEYLNDNTYLPCTTREIACQADDNPPNSTRNSVKPITLHLVSRRPARKKAYTVQPSSPHSEVVKNCPLPAIKLAPRKIQVAIPFIPIK